ncbi:MFS transporter [Albibacterium indicum]|uniref:MFS transporter n=1 Tax=Albibacterium indicum TaxID=2292082 RepID=UPI000E4F17BD|nr:MFS transporter [Pedobacter indicus]
MQIFRSLKYHNYRLFFTGQSISLIGTWMQRVAISWLVYRLTGSPFILGLITFASLIPSLVLAPFAGSLVDRYNKFHIFISTQIVLMLQAGTLALMVWLDYYNIVWIGVLSLVQGLVNSLDVTARQSLVVNFVEKKEDLPNAIALNSSMFNGARLIGPALAGMILSAFGENICFFLNFLTYIAVLVCLSLMKIKLNPTKKSKENIWFDLKEGFNYLKRSPNIFSLILLMAASSLIIIPFTTFLPVFAKDIFHGDATTFSWFESAGGLGALIGAIYMATLKSARNFIKIIIRSSFMLSLSVLGLALAPTLIMALIFTGTAALGLMSQNSSINTYLQTHTPDNMRGRTMSYYIMAFQGVLPIGTLIMGYLAHQIGTITVVAMEGLAGILIMTSFILYRRNRFKNIKEQLG